MVAGANGAEPDAQRRQEPSPNSLRTFFATFLPMIGKPNKNESFFCGSLANTPI